MREVKGKEKDVCFKEKGTNKTKEEVKEKHEIE